MDSKAQYPLLKAFFNALPLDDETRWDEPEGRAKYVDGLHTSEGRDPVDELATNIRFNESGTTYLFTGHRGSGKTVELKRLARDLNEDGSVALYVNMVDYISETEPIGIADLLTALLGAFSEAVNQRFGGETLAEPWWERFRHFMQSKVELTEAKVAAGIPSPIGKERLASVDMKLAIKSNPTFRERLREALATSMEAFVTEARTFADEVVDAIRKRAGDPACKVILIADSLEKIRGSGAGADRIYQSLDQTFHGNAGNLRFNTLHVVLSVPPTLPLIAPGVSALYSGGLHGLPQVKVESRPSRTVVARTRHQPGVDLMVALVARRFPSWPDVFSLAQLERMAVNSGGNIRIFFGLIRRVLLKAPRVALPLTDDALITYAENDVRADAQLTIEDREWLTRVSQSHDWALDCIDHLGTLGRLCDNLLILDYRNGEPWYDVLPLIRRSLAPPA